ncbi:glycosyltransferase family 4 protein [Bremerella cremea]|uniref:glycosyltransferase family 4 protein n=1 Tax=Bremerella cremea TaxID=1031537 RepID=UPI0031EACE18
MDSVHPLFVATYPPEECGLATFTKDSADAVDVAADDAISSVMAIQKTRRVPDDDLRVVHVIDNGNVGSYRLAAQVANQGPCNIVSLQHEFGLYPGDWGARLMEFVRNCDKPIVTTFHTLLADPPSLPKRLIREIAIHSKHVVVMTHIAAQLLADVYRVDRKMIRVIPHGVPEVPFTRKSNRKEALGFDGRSVICTFGLINRGKGLEQMIRAMPRIVAHFPNALYLVVGATHPLVKLQEGEAYRDSLALLAKSLGVAENVQFVNQYLSLPDVISRLQACDVFVTPYPGRDQIASGTMAYAMATVGAIVSTPYLYAEEVLADGRGMLVPFGDSQAMAESVVRLLASPQLMEEMRLKAYEYTLDMFWPNVGRAYLELFTEVVRPVSSESLDSPRVGLSNGVNAKHPLLIPRKLP